MTKRDVIGRLYLTLVSVTVTYPLWGLYIWPERPTPSGYHHDWGLDFLYVAGVFFGFVVLGVVLEVVLPKEN